MDRCNECFREMTPDEVLKFWKERDLIDEGYRRAKRIRLKGIMEISHWCFRFFILEVVKWRKSTIRQMLRHGGPYRFDFYGVRLWSGIRLGFFLTGYTEKQDR